VFEQFFLTRPLLNGTGRLFAVSRTQNEIEIYYAVISIRSDAAGVDGIPLSSIKLLLPVVLLVLTHIFSHSFVSSVFPEKWKTSVVLPISKVGSPAKFSDYRPVFLTECVSIWTSSAS
jgi:hypothetical protein